MHRGLQGFRQLIQIPVKHLVYLTSSSHLNCCKLFLFYGIIGCAVLMSCCKAIRTLLHVGFIVENALLLHMRSAGASCLTATRFYFGSFYSKLCLSVCVL